MLANPNEMRREQVRRASNRERALEALMRAGERGILNLDLMAIAGSRAGGRVDELRQQGHRITCEQVERGVYRYTLQSDGRAVCKPPALGGEPDSRGANRGTVAHTGDGSGLPESFPDSLPAATGTGLLFDLHALTD